MSGKVREYAYVKTVGYPDGVFRVTCRVREEVLGQAVWTTRGRGFGRRTGWLVQGEGFHVTAAFRGRTPVPGKGGVLLDDPRHMTGNVPLAGPRMLDLGTGQIFRQSEKCERGERIA